MAKKRKTNHKKQVVNIIKVVTLSILLVISLSTNIAQIIIHNNLKTTANDISGRLNNYRNLQTTQISTVRENCRRMNEIVLEPLGYYLSILRQHDESLATDYTTNVRLRCRLPALLVAGKTNFNDIDEYDQAVKDMFIEHSYVIKDEAYEDVKW